MHLKSIEINGFKSFAHKMVFEFPHGITGIVGPNGSGKSNIADAVRWVLGEQSAKQLRGSRMEDVIFSGTESRRPLGLAYVAMVFDNHDRKINLDYDEVKVARRVYRSGESEYLINGTVCRRRDIIEIFYDTGIGKEGYSIIGQGQVEKILGGKIEDSRELFDEAAGIAKYKKNRAVTEKSLEQEHQNLERVTDVLNELEKRVGPLESQSRKAKEYLQLKEKEKDLDLHLFLYDQNRLKKESQEIQGSYEVTVRDLEETRKAAEEIKEENSRLNEELEEVTARTDAAISLREEKSREREEIEKKEQELTLKSESNLRLISHYGDLVEEEIAEEEKKAAASENYVQEEKKLAGAIQRRKEDLEEKELAIEILKKKEEALTRKTQGERDRLFLQISNDSDTREKISRFRTMEEQLRIRDAEYQTRLIGLRSEKEDSQKKEEALKEERDQVAGKEEEFSLLEERLSGEYSRIRKEEKELSGQLNQARQDYVREKSHFETMRTVTERYDGYQNSIRQVMERKKSFPGILGVVADLLTMEKKYETAIEIALGGALQNIVTEDNETAKGMISILKKQRLGRATFLPLSNIRKKNIAISPYVLEEEGVIGTASSLVKTEKRYEDLVVSLLGRTIVVDTIDHALALNRKNHFSLRIVTLDGELLNPGGAITGGTFRHAGNLLGRKRELTECRERMAGKEDHCRTLEERIGVLKKQRKELSEQLSSVSEELSDWRLRLHDLSQQLPEIRKRREDREKDILSLRAERSLLKDQLSEIQTGMEELQKEKESNEKLHEENHDILHQLNKELEDLSQELSVREGEKNQLLLDLSKEEQQLDYIRTEISRLDREGKALRDQQADHRAQAAALEEDNRQLLAQTEQLQQRIGAFNEEIGRIGQELSVLKEEQKSLRNRQNQTFAALSEKNERLILLEKETDRMQTRLERIKENLDAQLAYMWDNYEITANYALELKRYDISSQEVSGYRKEKKETGRALVKLGSVNVNAIEEYKEVKERYEFMKGQYDDILAAEENLAAMIRDLNREMKELFTQQFANIRAAFQKVFAELFEGGKADLILMDEENILECGIRIVAQPPGKKLQNILLLSGGERALTAIALLFAIQQLKPSPFCLLDEIEAALDDANILRFSRYLKKLAQDTQFIVITHRRGTMTAAESLYGITMQEKGVSALISVDLIDRELA